MAEMFGPDDKTWQVITDEIKKQLKTLRGARENTNADMHSLDRNLGAIKELEKLISLPERLAQKPRTVRSVDLGGKAFLSTQRKED